jgi:hypothetical protein
VEGCSTSVTSTTCILQHAVVCWVTAVNIGNILDEELRIRERWRQMNSKVKDQSNKAKLDAY